MIEDELASINGEEPEHPPEGTRELVWRVDHGEWSVMAWLRNGEWRIHLSRFGRLLGWSVGQTDIIAALYMADPNAGGEWAALAGDGEVAL